jgi:spore maturation protein CgeB
MKILIRHEPNASNYIYAGIANAFNMKGHEAAFWHQENVPAFDVFNAFQPDIFIGQGYNLDRATIKCLARNPETKVLLKVGCWGPVCQDVDTEKYPILNATDEEMRNVGQVAASLSSIKNLVLFNYVHPNRKDYLMAAWEETVASTIGLLPAADPMYYFQETVDENLKCDIGFVGGYWPYKGENLDKYIIPLCHPVGKYNIKIFGNQAWPVPQYMGMSNDTTARNLFSSATICPNVSEPHANVFGFEVNERVFKLAASKSFFISDRIDSLTEDIFTKGEAVVAENPEKFHNLVDNFIQNPEQRDSHIAACYETVMKSHTYAHRVQQILESFN